MGTSPPPAAADQPLPAPAGPDSPGPAQPGAPLLRLVGVRKRFGQVLVADGLDLTVGAGEAVGIVGPNGAGKTSLFGIVSGDLRPDHGEVLLAGRRVTGLAPPARCRLGVGRTYQVPRPFEHMTVFENVLVAAQQGGGLRGRAGAERAGEVLGATGLLSLVNLPAGRLTLLQRKRLEIARALGTGPRLLLLDEVAGGLTDPEVDELVHIVRQLHAGGLAIIWIEHVVHALTSSVDRLICLANGAFVADGRPAEVLASARVREVYLGGGLELAGAGAGAAASSGAAASAGMAASAGAAAGAGAAPTVGAEPGESA